MKKIVCLASYQILPAKTGGTKSIDTFYQNLAKQFEVVCISTKNNDVSKAKGYLMMNILSNSALRYINVLYVFKLSKIIKQLRPDYIQLEHPYYGWLAIILSKYTRVKLIVRSHNIEGLRFKNLGKWWWNLLMKYEGWVHRNADINYFISDEDKSYAIKHFGISTHNAYTITFGIDRFEPPTIEQEVQARNFLNKEHGFKLEDVILLFNGAFDYKPNYNALHNLIKNIFPLLPSNFKLIICGKNIPEDITSSNINSNIILAGFVPDIEPYLTGASLFVNPLTEGGGIKTKLVEALGFNLTSVSFENGAIGVPQKICGEKLLVVTDYNWQAFADAIKKASTINANTPSTYYDRFSYKGIIGEVKRIL